MFLYIRGDPLFEAFKVLYINVFIISMNKNIKRTSRKPKLANACLKRFSFDFSLDILSCLATHNECHTLIAHDIAI